MNWKIYLCVKLNKMSIVNFTVLICNDKMKWISGENIDGKSWKIEGAIKKIMVQCSINFNWGKSHKIQLTHLSVNILIFMMKVLFLVFSPFISFHV